MKKIILDKVFTREFPLLLNQLWGRSYDSFFGHSLKTSPIQVFVMKNGITTVYRNFNIHDEINGEYLKQVAKDKSYFQNVYDKSLEQFGDLAKMWSKEALSREELIDFYHKAIQYWLGEYSSVYVPKYPKLFSSEVIELFTDLRVKTDIMADKSTDIMIRSLMKNYNLSQKSAYYVSYEDLLGNNVDIKNLEKTMLNDLYIVDLDIVSQKEFISLKNKYNFDLEELEIGDEELVRGTIAQKGLVRGKVKLLMKRSEIDKVEAGDIIVTYMTVPDYVPAMKLAAAFVTDEGGITCHAAIISRELKKPCIIGTKIATKVFKDGDMVEVDANKGIVKKLN
jgi:phosphohistidine swiveling domain-containing protein